MDDAKVDGIESARKKAQPALHLKISREVRERSRRKKRVTRKGLQFLPTFRWIPKKKNRCAVSVRGTRRTPILSWNEPGLFYRALVVELRIVQLVRTAWLTTNQQLPTKLYCTTSVYKCYLWYFRTEFGRLGHPSSIGSKSINSASEEQFASKRLHPCNAVLN